MALDILSKHHIQSFIPKAVYSVHDQPRDNGPNTNLKNLYSNARMNWIRHHGTLKITPPHINYILVEKWEDFKISSATIAQNDFKKKNLLQPIDLNYRVITLFSFW